ncbi:hypothetical protein PgNI_11271 [Pyricularia grisea]|uniref:Carrier domain-containing protein n=1 Tax=Pyricularia grisea TaxID=148305 RepID=A0A6P8APE7_PYRGI|nr:hypothetical protein PgNI_11271 [Pyricularia grisea]TLD03907.1 hypothetical protein PgNI_11271 [Pyricularia grisea]
MISDEVAATHNGEAVEFWQQYFNDLDASVFPALPSGTAEPRPSATAKHGFSLPVEGVQQQWELGLLTQTALAVLLAKYTNAQEALYGFVLEQLPSHGKGDRLTRGPTTVTLPTRVLCGPDRSAADIMRDLASHFTSTRELEHIGLDGISDINDFCFTASQFQTLLIVTTDEGLHASSGSPMTTPDPLPVYGNRALLIHCSFSNGSASLLAHYDVNVIGGVQVTRFLRQLGAAIVELQSRSIQLPLAGINCVTAEDREEIGRWSSKELKMSEQCIHQVVAEYAFRTPKAAAVDSWDGQWTFAELDNVSSTLALYIQQLETNTGAVVPICFERSKWVIASIFAVLKAGLAFTLIDPSHPRARIAQACRQTSAVVALTSKLCIGTLEDIVPHCIVVDDFLLASHKGASEKFKPLARPQDLAYIFAPGAVVGSLGRGVGARLWITDPEDIDRLAPIGAVGELVVESPGVARGYIGSQQQSNSPFYPTPPKWYHEGEGHDGFRFYRTGDLVRYQSDGTLVYLGRKDLQVKIRGQRVEIGDVETHLRGQLPVDITPVVEAIESPGASGSVILVAFLVDLAQKDAENPDTVSAAAAAAVLIDGKDAQSISSKLQQVVPQHSIPSHYIRLRRLPRGATGKMDRKRLRVIGAEVLQQKVFGGQSSASECSVAQRLHSGSPLQQIWFESLGLNPTADIRTNNFFDLGGDSIAAIKVVNLARRRGIVITVADVMRNPTLPGLEAAVRQHGVVHASIRYSEYQEPTVLSFAQGRMWFLHKLNSGAPWYLIPLASRLRGPLRLDALSRALHGLEKRHETLRTTFEERDGVGMQVVHPPRAEVFELLDLTDGSSDYKEVLHRLQTTPIDITKEFGWRVNLLRLGKNDHVLSIVLHHIISDGWSVDLLLGELGLFYGAADQDPLSCGAPLPIQYRNFAEWQQQLETNPDQTAEYERQLRYWIGQLKDSSPAELIADFPRPPILSGEADAVRFSIQGELYDALKAFSNLYQVTDFAVLLATFRATHYRMVGAENAAIGVPAAGRTRPELEDLVGFFVNTQCIQLPIGPGETFETLVQQAWLNSTTALENQDVPFERVVAEVAPGLHDMSRNPLVQLMFAVHSQTNLRDIELQGLVNEKVPLATPTRFDVEFHLFNEEGRFAGEVLFSKDLFLPQSVNGMVSIFLEILRQGIAEPHKPLATLALTDGLPEVARALQPGETDYWQDLSVVDVFLAQVKSSPDAIAIIDASSSFTYAELDFQSTKLASWLGRREITPETLVGVLAPRSCEAVVAFLGVLKANLAYLPLDVSSPTARIDAILSSVPGEKLILVGSDVTIPTLQTTNLDFVPINDTVEKNSPSDDEKPSTRPGPNSLAYAIFTSGSTGKPKGVMIEHKSILRLVKGTKSVTALHPSQPLRVAHLANTAFDASIWETYLAILTGGTLICIDYFTTIDAKKLGDVFVRKSVNVALLSPSLLKTLLTHKPEAISGLNVLFIGGDRLDERDTLKAQALIPHGVFNAYGPTENGVISTIFHVKNRDASDRFVNGVPIGHAFSDSKAYVMDPEQNIVPAGVMGELVVAGQGLARGYIGPDLDMGRFVHINIDGQSVRVYRTGDKVRWRPDGELEFFGRLDQQVKVRGHRIEPAEIEAEIMRHELVHEAAVVLCPHDGREELVGFATVDDTKSTAPSEMDKQVGDWKDLFDNSAYADIQSIDTSIIGRDFSGWTSMVDGSLIDRVEMEEWLDDTVHTLLDGQPAGHVLEIGTGSGMILFNLGDGLESYVGLEPSGPAVAFVTKVIKSMPALAERAKVHMGMATDLPRLQGLRPELVVVNSVAQYFPSLKYLEEVIDVLVSIPGIRRLFFGDMRSYAINQQFLVARVLHKIGINVTKAEVREKVAELEENEEELLVDPAFFAQLVKKMPHRVRHVEILPKKMRAANELSSYRYSAVIHLHTPDEPASPIYEVEESSWTDFTKTKMDGQMLSSLLQHSKGHMVPIGNIPHSMTIKERYILESLDGENEPGWISSAQSRAKQCASLSVAELLRLGEEAGYSVELSWARQRSQQGGLDVVFYRLDNTHKKQRTLFRFPADSDSSRSLASVPTQKLRDRRIETEIRSQLKAALPAYMVPAHIIILNQLPITVNGKLDRKGLADKAKTLLKKEPGRITWEAPRTEVEIALCEEFSKILGVKVSAADNFFDLGGHSLMATRLLSRINRRLDADASVKLLFTYPVVKDLAAALEQEQGSALYKPITSTEYQGPLEQSFAQGRLWFLDQLNPNATLYIMPLALRLRGHLQVDALAEALRVLEQRHEALRTTFKLGEGGVGLQVVHPPRAEVLTILDVADGNYEDILRREQTQPFDLTSEFSWRVHLLRLGENEHVLSIVMHHIIYDGWSIEILCRELSNLYSALVHGKDPTPSLPPIAVQYRDFSVWQKEADQVAEHERQLVYWAKQLQDSVPAEFFCDFPRPDNPSGKAGVVSAAIEGSLYENLQAFGRARRITTFNILLAAFRAAHYRLTGAEDAAVGTPVANRNRPELENIVGFFTNTQCIRIRLDAGVTFSGLVEQVRHTTAAAMEHQDVPFDRIVSRVYHGSNRHSQNPLVQLMFAVQTQDDLGAIRLERLTTESLVTMPSTRFDMELHLSQEAGRMSATVLFAQDLFHPATVRSILSVFCETLRRGLADPDVPIAELPLTDGVAELDGMGLSQVESTAYPRDMSIVDLFQAQVKLNRDAIAVTDTSSRLTYAELDEQSDKLASWLCLRGLRPEALVGVLAPRSCESIVAMLGILKACLAYLPLDVNVPADRIEAILSAVPGHKLILCGSSERAVEKQWPDTELVYISHALGRGDHGTSPTQRPLATSLAYVVFTSGSTGKPKGVMIEHRGVIRLVKDSNVAARLPGAPSVAHVANIAFDMAVWEIYAPLLNGGKIICIDRFAALDCKELESSFAREGVQAAMLPTAVVKRCIVDAPDLLRSMHTLLVGGELFDANDAVKVRALVPNGNLYNVYGPTENTILSTIHQFNVSEHYVNGVPIGKAVSNSGAYVMDSQQRLVSIGVVGELVLTGDGLARGYTDPALNQGRFIFINLDNQVVRAYRTGDRVRHRPKDGSIEFLGRMDQQVKIRGHRVEPAEVETALLAHHLVHEAIVVVRRLEGSDPDLVGFVTAQSDDSTHPSSIGDATSTVNGLGGQSGTSDIEAKILNSLRGLLPSYMVPKRVVVLDKMPLNENGKVDRKSLSVDAQAVPTVDEAMVKRHGPRNHVEAIVCGQFSAVLDVEVDISDNFFHLGGHSLLAAKVASSISRLVHARVSVRHIFNNPVVEELAAKIQSDLLLDPKASLGAPSLPITAPFELISPKTLQESILCEASLRLPQYDGSIQDVYPATHTQKLYLHNPATGSPRPMVPFVISFPPGSDCSRAVETCSALFQHFDIFRTIFLCIDGAYYQVVLKNIPVPIVISETEDDRLTNSTSDLLQGDNRKPTRLGEPAFHCTVLKNKSLSVVLQMSHAIYDGLSLEHIVYAVHGLYHGSSLPRPPSFVSYMQNLADSREEGYTFWRSLLSGSSMTVLETCHHMRLRQGSGSGYLSRILEVPRHKSKLNITLATVFTAACALALSEESASGDVLFGRVVSGRHPLPAAYQHVVGPCTNTVPVRVSTKNISRVDLLRQVQDQHLRSLPYEAIGFGEIKEHCADWSDATDNYGCRVAFHNFDPRPQSGVEGHRIKLETAALEVRERQLRQGGSVVQESSWDEEALYDVELEGFVEQNGRRLRIGIKASRQAVEEGVVDHLLEQVCTNFLALNTDLQDPTT